MEIANSAIPTFPPHGCDEVVTQIQPNLNQLSERVVQKLGSGHLASPGCVPALQQQPDIDGSVTLGDLSVNSILNSLPIPSLPGNTNIGGVAVNGPAMLSALGILAAAIYLFGGKSARSRSSKRASQEKKRLKRISELADELDTATRERL